MREYQDKIKANLYAYPRLNTNGLGNLLWIWGKCFLWSKDQGVQVIAPNWVQFHPFRYITLNPDLRNYWGYFTNKGYIKGWRKYYLLCKCKKLSIETLEKGKPGFAFDESKVIVFSNMGNFTSFIGRHREIYSELLRIAHPGCLPEVLQSSPFVAIHIRRGDFGKGTDEELRMGMANLQIPLSWYIVALRSLRVAVGHPFRVIIFSDGNDKELQNLLQEPDVKRSYEKNALKDLLLMSSAAALIASRSSFSLWASYLGQIPTLYHIGARPWTESIIHATPAFELEPEWKEGQPIPGIFVSSVASRISSWQTFRSDNL